MTNEEKRELRQLCKEGDSFEDIREVVSCADSTIKKYIKIFAKQKSLEVCNGE